MNKAKYNLEMMYMLVGVTEELRGFMEAAEILLPAYFRNAVVTYDEYGKLKLNPSVSKHCRMA